MSQDTNVSNLIINKLTKQQYEGITTPDPTQLYFVTDEGEAISGLSDVSLSSLSNGQILKYNSSTSKWENAEAPSGVFYATYGTTTFTDVMAAINAGKLVVCSETSGGSTVTFVYRSHSSSGVTFYNVYDGGNTLVSVDSSDVWNMSDSTFLPSQSGNSGKFLTTNGTVASWATVDALPSQSGNSGKFLTTNGTTASWATVPVPTYDSTNERITWA